MSTEALIAVAGIVITAILNGGGYLIAWGVTKGTVKALEIRVAALETEMKSVSNLHVSVAVIEERTKHTDETLRELTRRLEWVTNIAGPGTVSRTP